MPECGRTQAEITQGMPKHTPGPWRWSNQYLIADRCETWSLLGADGCRILWCGGSANLPQGVFDHANARLIAAAPELLNAAESMLFSIPSQRRDVAYRQLTIEQKVAKYDAAVAGLRAAIAKAKGEEAL